MTKSLKCILNEVNKQIEKMQNTLNVISDDEDKQLGHWAIEGLNEIKDEIEYEIAKLKVVE